MTPKINIGLQSQARIISFIKFGRIGEQEMALIAALVPFREGLAVTLGKSVLDEIEKVTGFNSATISTYLHRVSKRGIIKKSGKTIYLHPIYGLLDYKDVLISFD